MFNEKKEIKVAKCGTPRKQRKKKEIEKKK